MSSIAELTSKKKTDKGRKSLSPSVKENFHLRVKFGSKGDHIGTQNLFQPSKQTGSQSCKCESVANKMFCELRIIRKSEPFISCICLYQVPCLVLIQVLPSNVAFFA